MSFSHHVKSTGRMSLGIGVLVAGSTLAGVAASGSAHADPYQITATDSVNVRSAPGLEGEVVGTFGGGQRVESVGEEQNGWLPVRFMGDTAYISTDYVKTTPRPGQGGATDAEEQSGADEQSGNTGTAYTTTELNVRSGPGLQSSVVTTLSRGTQVTTTGQVRDGYTEIEHAGGSAWVSSRYLGDEPAEQPSPQAPAPEDSAPQAPEEQASEAPESASPQGPEAEALPKASGTKFATAALDIRTSSGADSTTVTEVAKGTELEITGVEENGRAQVIHDGAVRWVTAQYLSDAAPSDEAETVPTSNAGSSGGVTLPGLQPTTASILTDAQQRYPQIQTYHGVRPDPIPDHPSGRALDLMIPDWSNNNALGWEIANYYRANAAQFDVKYIIFDQQIWSVARDGEGWRQMGDRGSHTANHLDHVHISVN